MNFNDALGIVYGSRFPQGRDHGAEEPQAWASCEGCRRDIYPGDDILTLQDGAIVHDDYECLKAYSGATMREAG